MTSATWIWFGPGELEKPFHIACVDDIAAGITQGNGGIQVGNHAIQKVLYFLVPLLAMRDSTGGLVAVWVAVAVFAEQPLLTVQWQENAFE